MAGLLGLGCTEHATKRPPNVLLISIDTLRADHLGCYGHNRPTSPVIDALAGRGVLFQECFAAAPNTAPSHMSVMTSLFPTAHAVPNAAAAEDVSGLTLPPSTLTLAAILSDAGYQSVGFADGGNVGREFGFDRGFERYRSFYEGARSKVDQTIAWLRRQRDPNRPFFIFLHTYETHAPYLPPQEFADRFVREYDGWVRPYVMDEAGKVRESDLSGFNRIFDEAERLLPPDVAFLRDLYDAEIAYTDRELGRLLQFLREQRLDEDLLIVLISDHGEEFGEHGAYGHKQVFDEVTRVPLILNGPMLNAARAAVPEQVSLLDVLPTVLDVVGVDAPEHIQGQSLLPLLRSGGTSNERTVFSELIGPEPGPILSMMRSSNRKLIHYRSPRSEKDTDRTPAVRFYDLTADPKETESLVESRREVVRALRKQMSEWERDNMRLRERYGARRAEAADSSVKKELEQLGY